MTTEPRLTIGDGIRFAIGFLFGQVIFLGIMVVAYVGLIALGVVTQVEIPNWK
jgi:hypothetical protein